MKIILINQKKKTVNGYSFYIFFRLVLIVIPKIQHGQVLHMVYLFVWTALQSIEVWESI
jgi:hypothetical protein